MSAPPEPLPPTLISLLLEYITPPSLLAPLPPHLLSSPLAQRHHFLHISPHDPAQYLAWPSDLVPNAQQLAVHLLESIHTPLYHSVYTIRYTADAESSFAHVAVSTQDPPGLRLVFQWAPDGWKFHNLALMPFPTNSHDSVHDLLTSKPHDSLDDVDSNEHDSYWDAYAHSDDSDDQRAVAKSKTESEQDTEDAYWAQYSTVHGSADSARPTPPIITRKFENDRVILDFPSHHTFSVYNPLAPPSPRRLADLLANVSPRAPSPPLNGSDSGFDSASFSEKVTSPSVSLPLPELSSASRTTMMYTPSMHVSSAVEKTPDVDVVLKDTIRGVYHLWRARRVIDSSNSDKDREEFLEIVRQALTI
ncbi:hypothetical protein C0989_001196 [Termitomyces sp. Mn162]|nr:hypothetical protein C0989_001196 [Termitomyces sp. Mn162]KAH0590698.1 hypothetical protein H2248_000827 [Termitomyces sp. 'cryptogamus']